MRVRVPASSGNLGPGFDCLGLAWQLWNEIEFLPRERGLTVSGCEERFRKEDNLAVRAFRHTLRACGRAEGGLEVRFGRTEIPVARGLGSSASLIAAGVAAADALGGLGLGPEEKLFLAAELEGHPDNVASALFGGLTASFAEEGRVFSRCLPLSGRLRFVLLIPPFELSTEKARGVLPAAFSRADAVYALSHAALLPRALADGDLALLRYAMRDRLHQPYRFPLIAGADKALAAAEDSGAALCISGAGSTLLAVTDREESAAALEREAAARLPAWRVAAVRPDEKGTTVLER